MAKIYRNLKEGIVCEWVSTNGRSRYWTFNTLLALNNALQLVASLTERPFPYINYTDLHDGCELDFCYTV